MATASQEDNAPWALITGASDGIGYGFAQELLSRGCNVILHGRNQAKLEKCSAALLTAYPARQTKLFVADASTGSMDADALLTLVAGLNLTVLVNNVGGTHPLSEPFKAAPEYTDAEVAQVINLNAGFTTLVTKTLLPVLAHRTPALVLNIGSLSYLGGPWVSVYAGTKAYLMSYSIALAAEMLADGRDVTVHAVLVGAVSTAGLNRKTSFFIPSARVMAAATLDRAGAGGVFITPFWPHALQAFALQMLPQSIVQRVLIKAISRLKDGPVEKRD